MSVNAKKRIDQNILRISSYIDVKYPEVLVWAAPSASTDAYIKTLNEVMELIQSSLPNLTDKCKKRIHGNLEDMEKWTIKACKSKSVNDKTLAKRSIASILNIFDKLKDLLKGCTKVQLKTENSELLIDELISCISKFTERETGIVGISRSHSKWDDFKKFLLSNVKEGEIKVAPVDEMKAVLSTLHGYGSILESRFRENVQNEDVRRYILSLLRVWNLNVQRYWSKIMRTSGVSYTNMFSIYYCATVILRRIIFAMLMNMEDKDTEFGRFINMNLMLPTISDIESILQNAVGLNISYKTTILRRLKTKLDQSKLSTKEQVKGVTQQDVRLWQQRLSKFLEQFDEKAKATIQKQQQTKQQQTRQQAIQQKQQDRIYRQAQQKSIDFSYISPRYKHRDRIYLQQNQKLGNRKAQNLQLVQDTIQQLPEIIMRKAITGKYTSIILVDVANQLHKFGSIENMYENLKELIPWEVPKIARKKPLYVFIKQGNLDQTKRPKADVDESMISSHIIQIRVSCVKHLESGQKEDCYKKRYQGDFTKNPMDDFVLLTLKYILRSYYYNYMGHLGVNTSELKNVEEFEELLAENPYGVLFEEEDVGSIIHSSYKKSQKSLNKIVPYTWAVSDDLWRDWYRN